MRTRILSLFVLVFVLVAAKQTSAQGTAFIYHGQLTQKGQHPHGERDMRFGLFAAPINGNPIATLDRPDVPVRGGEFTVTLDFGNVFDGNQRWLEISVRSKGGQFVTLKPRQKFMPTPYAIIAGSASNLLGTLPATQLSGSIPTSLLTGPIPASQLSGTLPDAQLSPNVALLNSSPVFSGSVSAPTFNGNGAGITGVNAATLNGASNFWRLNGNAGTTAGPNFLGTTDNQALELKVNNQRAFRLEPTTNSPNVIAGWSNNMVASNVVGSVISGGGGDGGTESNSVASHFGNVNGGSANSIGAKTSPYATIAGGHGNAISGSSGPPVGPDSRIDYADHSSIGGGRWNTIFSWSSVIAGGTSNRIGAFNGGIRNGGGHTIGGGSANRINFDNGSSTIAGGNQNFIDGSSSVIAGGSQNSIVWVGNNSGNFIAGGFKNLIGGDSSSIGGGQFNTVRSRYSSISGGQSNLILSVTSGTIAGGVSNLVSGDYGFAAGYHAKALHRGSFVWADYNQSGFAFPSTQINQFSVRAGGGARFVSAIDTNGTPTAGVELPAGGGSWATLSDRNAKENLSAVNPRDVLERVAQMPISTWNYKSQDTAIRHIGPMAQDFAAAFQVGEDQRRITTVDADGVALAAIQGLNQIVTEKDTAIQKQAAEIQKLKQRLEKLEALIQPKTGGQQ